MRYRKETQFSIIHNEDGATLILIAGLTVVFVAFTAMAVDIAHLYVVKNELQNAADAGALAGARCLYDCFSDGSVPGSIVNTESSNIAYAAARANKSERVPVEVTFTGNNETDDVQRGHWSFATRNFTPLDRTDPPDLWGLTASELDNPEDPIENGYVNAVRVKTSRKNPQAASFFARILGFMGFNVEAEAIAYLGFAGTTEPGSVDLPIAICKQALLQTGEYQCSIGRMINSSPTEEGNTGGWTDYRQDDNPCSGSNATKMDEITGDCPIDQNVASLIFGQDIALNNGQISEKVFGKDVGLERGVYDCWKVETEKKRVWTKTLPVIDCENYPGPIPNCAPLIGVVKVNIMWMNDQNDPQYTNAPREMEAIDMDGVLYDRPAFTSGPTESGKDRWDRFVSNYGLKDAYDNPAEYLNMTMYFLPQCSPQEPRGGTGGQNFGILAKIPVLVD